MMSNRRQRCEYSKEFKQQIVDLHNAGKPRNEVISEYELTSSTFDRWVREHNRTGSFKHQDNLTPEQKELNKLKKRNAQLEMENDILNRAALIFGRRSK